MLAKNQNRFLFKKALLRVSRKHAFHASGRQPFKTWSSEFFNSSQRT